MNVKDTFYVGIADENVRLFEGQYLTPEGMRYNSYLISDEKIAVMDSVDGNHTEKWLENVAAATGGKSPDYLVVSHVEPDHSGSIKAFTEKYPKAVVVGNAKTFQMIEAFYGEIKNETLVVANGATLSLGKHELTFTFAPMVHWPEVMVTYDSYSKTLFSADAFGKFGAGDDVDDWACEARRYYFGIVGKYGAQVQALLKKAAAFEIENVCSLHGPVLSGDLSEYFELYDVWSRYEPEKKGVAIVYASVYGNTKKAAETLKEKLEAAGIEAEAFDLTVCDIAEAVEGAFEFDKLVLASTTYNAEVFPKMREFLADLKERNYQNRTVAFIENGSWAPMAKKVMTGVVETFKNVKICEASCTIKSGYKSINDQELDKMVEELK